MQTQTRQEGSVPMRDRHHTLYPRRRWQEQPHTYELRNHPRLIIPTERTAHNALHADRRLKTPPRPDRILAAFCLDVLGGRNEANQWDTRFDGVNQLIGQLLLESEDEPSPRRADTMYALARNLGRQVVILGGENGRVY